MDRLAPFVIYAKFEVDETVAFRIFTLTRHAPLGIENAGLAMFLA